MSKLKASFFFFFIAITVINHYLFDWYGDYVFFAFLLSLSALCWISFGYTKINDTILLVANTYLKKNSFLSSNYYYQQLINTKNSKSIIQLQIKYLLQLSQKVKNQGILELEKEQRLISDKFLKECFIIAADNISPETVEPILIKKLQQEKENNQNVDNTLGTISYYANSIGFIGTLIGLLDVTKNLNESSLLLNGLQTVLLSTLYGVFVSHFIIWPLKQRFNILANDKENIYQMNIDAILAMLKEENSLILQQKLNNYLQANS